MQNKVYTRLQDSVAGLSRLGKFLKLELLSILDHQLYAVFKVVCFVHLLNLLCCLCTSYALCRYQTAKARVLCVYCTG